ncbi:hypothetical protein L5515_011704 [Caenorhabditis briggsae]|uniref:PAX-interacting protein 1 n=2 Tax=Caenorhabditis briggsae TaxID=6238 RepID=A0AAE9JET7_CAEBR|nr:hypothetical protein L5515_011704 [Caenorhabditis briggsae]
MSDPLVKEEDMQHRPESPPLGLLDPSRIQNPLANEQIHQIPKQEMPQQQMPQQQMPHASGFVMPEQPRQQPPPQNWQRTPTMSPANIFQAGSVTPGSQRSSTGTPNHPMGCPPQQQFFHGESPIQSQGAPMTPQSAGPPPGSNCGTPQSAGAPNSGGAPYDYQAAQMQQQQHAQAMAVAAAQQQSAQQQAAQQAQQAQQQQYVGQPNPQQMHDSPFRQHPMMGMHQHPGHSAQYPPGYPPNAQWQQQMYARQAAQQRAAAQRVPYPQGAYPAGMQGPPGPMTPVYPPPTPTANRTTPGSAGPVSGPPGTPQRPQYPQGTNPQPPPQPQFTYPPAQQMTPTGQLPGYPGIPGTPTFPSPAHQMYRQGPPTAPAGMPGMRQQYISPQQQPVPPGTPHRFAPQAAATSSPHFAPAPGNDLRSPSLMSPNQQQSQQHTPVLPRAIHNEMPPHPMRPVTLPSQQLPPPQGTPQPPLSATSVPPQSVNQFVYRQGPPPGQMHHDPFPVQMNSDPELFLAGFHFHCFDSDRMFQDKLDRKNLEFMIRFHGGEIEFEPSKFSEKVHQVTHVLIDSCRNPNVRQSLELKKRIISMQWIADVLEKEKADIPWKLAHLPPPFYGTFIPYLGKLFALSGYDESERGAISFMVEAMGAKITPFFSRKNDLLIAKSPSEKVTKAQEWKVPVVNFQWLADAYVCASGLPHVENPRYQVGQECQNVNGSPSQIEISSNEFAAMICCWKQPCIIGDQDYDKAQAYRKELQSNPYYFPAHKVSTQSAAPTDEEIEASVTSIEKKEQEWKDHMDKLKEHPIHKDLHLVPKPSPRVSAWFGDAIDEENLEILKKKVKFLGGKCVDKIEHATHVVMMSGRRSLALLESIIRGKNIVVPEWIVDSYKYKNWLDTMEYFLRDRDLEKEFAYNCKRSVLRARHKPVFEDIEFHVTRFVEPNQKDLIRLIELSGGKIHLNRPDPKYLAHCVEIEHPFIIISCHNDARFLSYLGNANLPIYNVDLILFAMLRQVVEPLPQFRIPIPIVVKPPRPPPYSDDKEASSAVSPTPMEVGAA